MLDLSTCLKYYKREDIQKEMIKNADGRETAIKFGEKGFGKRPDILQYPQDVLELAKQGATSFHVSEERWSNALRLDPMLKKKEMNELRTGWDLVLDIDCDFLEYSKLAADLLIRALKHHGIKSISAKFSGNKGFHIAVPFEAFPEKIQGEEIIETKDYFPDSVRLIASYLSEMIMEPLSDRIYEYENKSIEKIKQKTGKSFEGLTKDIRRGAEKVKRFDAGSILKIDTVLISSRHLYRCVYSLHEKSGLASIPVELDKILIFSKEDAVPENVNVSELKFLDKKSLIKNEAKELMDKSIYWQGIQEKKEELGPKREYEELTEALNEKFFPPCIKKGLNGLDDGKKRFLFILVNFLSSVGWNHEEIEKFVIEWNKKNPDSMRETYFLGQIRYHKQHKKKVLPPNCHNKMYYKDMGLCFPDNLCGNVKNPVNYARRKARYVKPVKKKEDKKEAVKKEIKE